MASLVIDNLSTELMAQLCSRAKVNRRSAPAEAKHILEHYMAKTPPPTLVYPDTPPAFVAVDPIVISGRPVAEDLIADRR